MIEPQSLIQPDAQSKSSYADEATPLIRNCWYVAAFSEEITREPKQRYILGNSVVLYRTEAGEVVALQDRCPHRSFPLSNGYLEGDNIVCRYHGLTFNRTGVCVRAPMAKVVPAQVKVTSYPVKERGPLIWIWPGDPEKARDEDCPGETSLEWLSDPNWATASFYIHFKVNYILFHENVIDMTHFSFLHPDTAGTPEWASCPFHVTAEGKSVRMVRRLEDSPAPALYAGKMGFEATRPITKTSDVRFVSPAIQVVYQTIEDRVATPPRTFQTRVLNIFTPETGGSTHHFWLLSRDWEISDPVASEHLLASGRKAVMEDKVALEAIAVLKQVEGRTDFREASFPSDRAGMAVRKLLKEAAETGSW